MRRRVHVAIFPNTGFLLSIQDTAYGRTNCPITIGSNTVPKSWMKTLAKGTSPDKPKFIKINMGDTNIPRKLPNAELKIAPGSFPDAVLVNMTAEETGGGIQLTMTNPRTSDPLNSS